MTKYSTYLVFITILLVEFTPHVKCQTQTTLASDTTITSVDAETSTETSNATEKNISTTTTENDTSWRKDNEINEREECGCNEHLGYICGCGERCPYPNEFGIGPVCPQYCLDTLTCVCNEGYGRDYETNLCVLCPEYYYK